MPPSHPTAPLAPRRPLRRIFTSRLRRAPGLPAYRCWAPYSAACSPVSCWNSDDGPACWSPPFRSPPRGDSPSSLRRYKWSTPPPSLQVMHNTLVLFYSFIIVQKSRVYPTVFWRNYFLKESTLYEKPIPFSRIPHSIQGKSRLFELTRKKIDSVGTTGIFHLIILNTISGFSLILIS